MLNLADWQFFPLNCSNLSCWWQGTGFSFGWGFVLMLRVSRLIRKERRSYYLRSTA